MKPGRKQAEPGALRPAWREKDLLLAKGLGAVGDWRAPQSREQTPGREVTVQPVTHVFGWPSHREALLGEAPWKDAYVLKRSTADLLTRM